MARSAPAVLPGAALTRMRLSSGRPEMVESKTPGGNHLRRLLGRRAFPLPSPDRLHASARPGSQLRGWQQWVARPMGMASPRSGTIVNVPG